MKRIFYVLSLLLIFGCSSDDGESNEEIIQEPLTLIERLSGKWQQTGSTITDEDGNTTERSNFCIDQTTYEFFATGTFNNLDVEGGFADPQQCVEFLFEGRWRPTTNPEDPEDNMEMINDFVDGSERYDDWDYVRATFPSSNRLELRFKFDGGGQVVYRYIKI